MEAHKPQAHTHSIAAVHFVPNWELGVVGVGSVLRVPVGGRSTIMTGNVVPWTMGQLHITRRQSLAATEKEANVNVNNRMPYIYHWMSPATSITISFFLFFSLSPYNQDRGTRNVRFTNLTSTNSE